MAVERQCSINPRLAMNAALKFLETVKEPISVYTFMRSIIGTDQCFFGTQVARQTLVRLEHLDLIEIEHDWGCPSHPMGDILCHRVTGDCQVVKQ